MKRRVVTALTGLMAACAACGAWAQYPEKPVRIVVPYMEMLKKSTGVQMVHVPYKSPPLALADLLGGQVQVMFSDQATAFIQANAGKVRALVSTSLRRSPLFPQVPTLAEAGISGIPDMPGWWALYGPAGLRKDLVERINREVNVILQRPEIREKLLTVGIEMMGSTPEELATFTREQLQHYVRLLKEFNIKPD